MRIAIAADHAGAPLLDVATEVVRAGGHEPLVIGEPAPGDDYPDVAVRVGEAIQRGRATRGIALCGSGAGVTVAANKMALVRAAPAHEPYTARQMVEHDHANVLTLGARVIGSALAADVVRAFVTASFSGEERHVRRLRKVLDIEAMRVRGGAAQLRGSGQSLWLDGVHRREISEGALARWITDLAVSGVRSNPRVLERELRDATTYDAAIRTRGVAGVTDPQEVALALALDDLVAAADLLRVIHDATGATDGHASMEIPSAPLDEAEAIAKLARRLHARAGRPNLMVEVPGTEPGLAAVSRLVAAGIPVNVTPVFSAPQYRAALDAYLDGLEQRVARGEDPRIASVASLSVSSWDELAADRMPANLRNVGHAVAQAVYAEHRAALDSSRWRRLERAGAARQRLLFAGALTAGGDRRATGAPGRLIAPGTVALAVEEALGALTEPLVATSVMEPDTTALEPVRRAGLDVDAVASDLQRDSATGLAAGWWALYERVASKLGQPTPAP